MTDKFGACGYIVGQRIGCPASLEFCKDCKTCTFAKLGIEQALEKMVMFSADCEAFLGQEMVLVQERNRIEDKLVNIEERLEKVAERPPLRRKR